MLAAKLMVRWWVNIEAGKRDCLAQFALYL